MIESYALWRIDYTQSSRMKLILFAKIFSVPQNVETSLPDG
jgi:hypothetical protein